MDSVGSAQGTAGAAAEVQRHRPRDQHRAAHQPRHVANGEPRPLLQPPSLLASVGCAHPVQIDFVYSWENAFPTGLSMHATMLYILR